MRDIDPITIVVWAFAIFVVAFLAAAGYALWDWVLR